MNVFHGTGLKNSIEIENDGYIKEDSYFGDLNTAIEYASSFGDGVVFCVVLEDSLFNANILLNEAEYESGDTDLILEIDDLNKSLEIYDSVVSSKNIYNYTMLTLANAKSLN